MKKRVVADRERMPHGLRSSKPSPEKHAVEPAPRALSGLSVGFDLGRVPILPPEVADALRDEGQPLDPAVRAAMAGRLQADLIGVRIHKDARAAASARAMDAAAYTVGQHVVFGAGMYEPARPEGASLLAHELTHAAQNGAQRAGSIPSRGVSRAGDEAERQADAVAAAVYFGAPARPLTLEAPSALVHRTPVTWFRGGIKEFRISLFHALHDIGPGLYLTDDARIAELYADTRADSYARGNPGAAPARRYVKQTTVDPSKIKVLDLTDEATPIGKKWQQFMSERLKPWDPTSPTRRETITGYTEMVDGRPQKVEGQNERYSAYFKQFIRDNGVRLDDYDAVVSQELVRGGKQMALRNPAMINNMTDLGIDAAAMRKGTAEFIGPEATAAPVKPSAIGAAEADAPSRPASVAPVEAPAPPVRPRASASRIMAGAKATLKVGAAVGGATAAALLFSIIASMVGSKIAVMTNQAELERVTPQINGRIGALAPEVSALRAKNPGRPVYAVITLKTTNSKTLIDEHAGWLAHPARMELEEVRVSAEKVADKEWMKNEITTVMMTSMMYENTYRTFSVELDDETSPKPPA